MNFKKYIFKLIFPIDNHFTKLILTESFYGRHYVSKKRNQKQITLKLSNSDRKSNILLTETERSLSFYLYLSTGHPSKPSQCSVHSQPPSQPGLNCSFGEQANDHSCFGLIGEMGVDNGTHHVWPCRHKPISLKSSNFQVQTMTHVPILLKLFKEENSPILTSPTPLILSTTLNFSYFQ